jgi:hypothetical protein
MSKSNEEKLKEVLRKHSLIKWGCYKIPASYITYV